MQGLDYKIFAIFVNIPGWLKLKSLIFFFSIPHCADSISSAAPNDIPALEEHAKFWGYCILNLFDSIQLSLLSAKYETIKTTPQY